MKRFKKTWLVAGLGVVMVVGAGAIAWHLRTQYSSFYTDADAIRRPLDEVVPRDILWRPAVKLPTLINTAVDEREPGVTADGMTVFFVRGKPGFNADIFTSTRTPDGWTAPEPLDALNTPADELGPAPSPDGTLLYFHSDRADGHGGYDLWVSRRGPNGWQEPVNLGPDVNSAYHDYGPAMTPDGAVLYFASNRPRSDAVDAPAADAWLSEIREDYAKRDFDLYTAQVVEGRPGRVAAVVQLNTPQNEGSPAISSAGDFVYFSSDRDGGEGGYDIYRARLLDDGYSGASNLGDTLNSAANELDPALALSGFAIYFSSNRESEEVDEYDLYYAESREVFATSETYRATLDWESLWPYLLGMLLGLLGVLLSLLLLNAAHRLQYNRLTLLARCLLASLIVHMLLLLLFSAWGVTTALAEMFEQGNATRVILVSGATGGDLASQVRGQLTQLQIEAVSQAASRQEPAPSQSATQITPQALQVARSRIEADDVPDQELSHVREVAARSAGFSESVADKSVDQMAPAQTSVPTEAMRVDAREAQPTTPAAQDADVQPSRAREQMAITDQRNAAAVAIAPQPVDVPDQDQGPQIRLDAQPIQSVLARLPALEAGPVIPNELESVDADVSIADGPPAERVVETARTIAAATGEMPRHDVLATGAPSSSTLPTVEVTPAGSTYEPMGRSLAAEVSRDAVAQPQSTDLNVDTPQSVNVSHAPSIDVAQPTNVRASTVTEVEAGSDLAVVQSARTTDATAVVQTTASTDAIALAPDIHSSTGTELDSFVQPVVTDSRVAAAPESEGAQKSAIPFDHAAPVDVTLPALRSAQLTTPTIESQLPIARGPRTSSDEPVRQTAIATSAVVLPPDARAVGSTDRGSLAEVVVNDSQPMAVSDSNETIDVASAFADANQVDVSLPALRTEQLAQVKEQSDEFEMVADSPTLRNRMTERVESMPSAAAEARVVLIAPTVVQETELAATASTLTPAHGAEATIADISWPQQSQRTGQSVAVDSLLTELALVDEFSADTANEPNEQLRPRQEPARRGGQSRFKLPIDQAIESDSVFLDLAIAGSPNEDSIASVSLDRVEAMPFGNLVDVSQPEVAPLLAAAPFDLDLKLPTRTALTPDIYKQRAPDRRQELVQTMGGSEETERAVAMALDWLARHQSPDGRWDGARFDDRCGECGGGTQVDVDIALTGLALLCFLGTDQTHFNEGPYQEVVDRGLSWLVKQQRPGGDLMGQESMYSHGIASIALAEAFGMTGDPSLVEPVQSAIRFIYAARNTSVGGWRYAPGQVGDTSVLGWQMMALTSARRCGLDVTGEAFDVASNWLNLVTSPNRPGLYAYQPDREVTPAMTAEAMFVRQLLGRTRRDQDMQESADYLLQHPPNWDANLNTYYWYYATLALYQHQGDEWERWNEQVKDQLVAHQRTDGLATGSWSPEGDWAEVGGRVYQTAICALTLEVYYRYLPSFLSAETAEVPNMIRGAVTDATSGAPLVGAVVRIDRLDAPALTATTNASGRYVLIAPDLPDFFAVSASHGGYVPEAVNVASQDLKRGTVTRDFQLDPQHHDVIAIEAVPEVHHLGNDRFDGSINSRFQKKAEGTIFESEFRLTAEQLSSDAGQAEIVLLVKGAQVDNEIRINGNLLERFLDRAPRDGSFGEFTAEFPIQWLVEGTNTLHIRSVRGGDLDDFEFVNVRIRFDR